MDRYNIKPIILQIHLILNRYPNHIYLYPESHWPLRIRRCLDSKWTKLPFKNITNNTHFLATDYLITNSGKINPKTDSYALDSLH